MEKYMILTSENDDYDKAASELSQQVNEFIKAGWKIHGGVSISSHRFSNVFYTFAQAMTLEE